MPWVPEFYAHYRSDHGSYGCRQELITVPQTVEPFAAQGEDPVGPDFPAQLLYVCPRCSEDHTFSIREVYKVGSPRMKGIFLKDAEAKGIELHVEIPERD